MAKLKRLKVAGGDGLKLAGNSMEMVKELWCRKAIAIDVALIP
ncbi:hypothetical protein HanIR_Chr05g0232811 [Helianthus annuus]|nr:hypothetical protein HanIR_Chr05g0232811 [Helianthus annuus]